MILLPLLQKRGPVLIVKINGLGFHEEKGHRKSLNTNNKQKNAIEQPTAKAKPIC